MDQHLPPRFPYSTLSYPEPPGQPSGSESFTRLLNDDQDPVQFPHPSTFTSGGIGNQGNVDDPHNHPRLSPVLQSGHSMQPSNNVKLVSPSDYAFNIQCLLFQTMTEKNTIIDEKNTLVMQSLKIERENLKLQQEISLLKSELERYRSSPLGLQWRGAR
jgi:hypothetical protein